MWQFVIPGSTNTSSTCIHSQALFQKSPPDAHKKDGDQSRRTKMNPLGDAQARNMSILWTILWNKSLKPWERVRNSYCPQWTRRRTISKIAAGAGVRMWREIPIVAHICKVDHESGVWTLRKTLWHPKPKIAAAHCWKYLKAVVHWMQLWQKTQT